MGTIFSLGPENSGFRGATPAAQEQSNKAIGLQTAGAAFLLSAPPLTLQALDGSQLLVLLPVILFVLPRWRTGEDTIRFFLVSSSHVKINKNAQSRLRNILYPCIFILLLLIFIPLIVFLFFLPTNQTCQLLRSRSENTRQVCDSAH